MMMKSTLLVFFLSAAGTAAMAQPLAVPSQAPERADFEVPARGVEMHKVQARYGAPQAQYGPVGEPPITRWAYPDFIVVFEDTKVIHSVIPSQLHPVRRR